MSIVSGAVGFPNLALAATRTRQISSISPMSGASWFVVSCGDRLSEVGLSEIRKPQIRYLSYQGNPWGLHAFLMLTGTPQTQPAARPRR